MNRTSGILSLNSRLKLPDELPGLFLPRGYPERFEIMFLAEMPSMNEPADWNRKDNYNFGVTKRDQFFQNTLVKYDVSGSYCTDIVKRRDVPRKPTKEEVEEWRGFLLEEINIIRPRLILVVGKRTYETSYMPFISSALSSLNFGVTSDWIFHYCSQVPRIKFEERFGEVVKKYQHLLD